MAIRALLEHNPNRLRFEEFPTAFLDYQEEIPRDELSREFVHVQTLDIQTKKITSVFLKKSNLEEIGIPQAAWGKVSDEPKELSQLIRNVSTIETALRTALPVLSKHLSPEHLAFFEKIYSANHIIGNALYGGVEHLKKIKGVPGMYFHRGEPYTHIFINLKKTLPLGQGSYGTIRKAWWLNSPKDDEKIVAKKVPRDRSEKTVDNFKQEIAALQMFSEKKGIIRLIAGGIYDHKWAIFLPAYSCSLEQYMDGPAPFLLSVDDSLNLIAQWLEGLMHISEKGVHGDIKPGNLLLKKIGKEVQGVIADFGGYCSYQQPRNFIITLAITPPEYSIENLVTSKSDVWAMGISIHEFFSKNWLPCWDFLTENEMREWVSPLVPGWILLHSAQSHTPPFISELTNRMLDPRREYRPTAEIAFKLFLKGLASFKRERSQKSDAPEEVKA